VGTKAAELIPAEVSEHFEDSTSLSGHHKGPAVSPQGLISLGRGQLLMITSPALWPLSRPTL
jgi:hypothetical protein